MTDYTKVYDGAAKDTNESTITGADHDVEYDAIETAIATKQDSDVAVILTGAQTLEDKTYDAPIITNYAGGVIQTNAPVTVSGTEQEWAAIPAWAKRIIIHCSLVSKSDTSDMRMWLGDASAYVGTLQHNICSEISGSTISALQAATGQMVMRGQQAASDTFSGSITLDKDNNNIWSHSGAFYESSISQHLSNGQVRSLTGALTRIKMVCSSGTFDAGTMSITYEG